MQWVEAHGHLDLNELGARPVEAGKESNDTPLYIAQAHYHNGIHPGKCSTHLDGTKPFVDLILFNKLNCHWLGAFIPFGNTEKNVSVSISYMPRKDMTENRPAGLSRSVLQLDTLA